MPIGRAKSEGVLYQQNTPLARRTTVDVPRTLSELARRCCALSEETFLKETPETDIHGCLAYLEKHVHLISALCRICHISS